MLAVVPGIRRSYRINAANTLRARARMTFVTVTLLRQSKHHNAVTHFSFEPGMPTRGHGDVLAAVVHVRKYRASMGGNPKA